MHQLIMSYNYFNGFYTDAINPRDVGVRLFLIFVPISVYLSVSQDQTLTKFSICPPLDHI